MLKNFARSLLLSEFFEIEKKEIKNKKERKEIEDRKISAN